MATNSAGAMRIDDAPLNGFHVKVAAYTTGGLFIDGYILGMIGIALVQIGPQFGLGSIWTGLIGASALAGIFLGAPLFGWVTDRVGRQTMYVIDLLVFLVALILQFFVAGALALRLGTPESPRWLVSKGRVEEARSVVKEYIHPDADVDDLVAEQEELARMAERGEDAGYGRLFSKSLRRRTAFACLFWFCQVVPYFAIFTFSPTVLEALNISGRFSSQILPNLFPFAGGVMGVVIMDMMGRRTFVIWSFVILAAVGALLGFFPQAPVPVILVLFAVFAFVIAAAADLESVYPVEVFPTELRASGTGLAAGFSRIGAAIGTFLLPISVAQLGAGPTMLGATAVLVLGAVISVAWAPETRNVALAEAGGALAQSHEAGQRSPAG